MAGNKLIFQNADKAKAAITDAAKKDIAKLYQDWADEIGEKALYYKTKTNASSWLQEQNMRQLQAQLTATSHQISNEVYGIAKDSIYQVSDAVVQANNKWLIGLGFPVDGVNSAFVSVPDQTVRRLVTGQIYESGWSLSKAIWTDNEKTLHDIYGIVAKGLAENMSAYDISKLLEKYVSPAKAKQWNLTMPDGVKIYKRSVDYNAQRLVRTLAQHGYQQSFIAVTKDNPFVEDYIWVANGSRTCALCAERDGKHYAKDELPMDHPNGMCTMVPNVDNQKMIDRLADWVNNPDGYDSELDAFASEFGYEAMPVKTMEDFINKYGHSKVSPGAYWKNVTPYQKMEAEMLKKQMGATSWDKWYVQNVYDGDGKNLGKLKSWAGYSDKKAFTEAQEKYLTKYGFSSDHMPKDFDEWSHKISYNDASEILQSMGTSWGDPHPYQQLHKYYDETLLGVKPKKKVQTGSVKVAKAMKPGEFDKDAMFKVIKSQTESNMLKKEEAWLKQIGDQGIEGIERYTGSSYTPMNAYLRFKNAGLSEEEAIMKSGITERQLDSVKKAIKGLSKVELDKDYVLRRGTDLGDIAGAFMRGDFNKNVRKLENMSAEELNAMFQGATGTMASFTSTSSLYERGFPGDVEIIFKAPKGTHASSIMNISQFGTGEGETLLNAQTNVRCLRIEKSDGHMGSSIRVFLEIVL